jgi:hypothetical protein
VLRVRIGGRLVVEQGRLVLDRECEYARERITERVRQDERQRVKRQGALSSIMAEYLQYVDEGLRGR